MTAFASQTSTDIPECDSAQNNMELNNCSYLQIGAGVSDDKADINKMASGWAPAQKQLLNQLVKAAFESFNDRIDLEISIVNAGPNQDYLMDQSNPRDPLDIRKKFITNLKNYEAGQFPVNSASDFKKSDEVLNQIYRQMSTCLEKSANPDEECKLGRADKKQLLADQRKWLKYRYAWMRFGAARYPKVSAASWETWLTNERVADLKQMPNS